MRVKLPSGFEALLGTPRQANLTINSALASARDSLQPDFPDLTFSFLSFVNDDDTVDGELRIVGIDKDTHWQKLLALVGKYIPRLAGGFFVSIKTIFSSRRDLAKAKYDREARNQWSTSSYWQSTRRIGDQSVTAQRVVRRLKGKEYGYRPSSFIVRLHWNEMDENPRRG